MGLPELEETLLRVSSPSNPDYGMHLTNDEVNALTAPEPAHIRAVEDFVRQHGAEPRALTPNSDMIAATVSMETAERMLNAEYKTLKHASGVQVTRAIDGYSLPDDVAAVVDFVSPTVHIPGVRRPQVQDEPDGIQLNTPKNLRQLYSVGDVEGKSEMSKHAVTAFLEQGYGDSSLKMFWNTYCQGINCGKGDVHLIGDATSNVTDGVEAMLDIETITGVAGNVDSSFWGFAGRSPDNKQNEPFMKWLAEVSSTSDADVPKIFSTSYGEDESSWSKDAAMRLDAEFQKAGARGISLLFASGDSGANCKLDGKFHPQTPGSSPWITAVGGTMPTDTWPQPGGEAAILLSSGGFSNYHPMPDYQKDAVKQYLGAEGLPPASKGYNTEGRAYPDISAQAINYLVIANNLPIPGVAGTSCASPAASGIFSLLNDLRMQSGKSSLGFLNPFIYENMKSFNDITTGVSEGCLTGLGWPAKAGWDAVTGVGTPNYANLAKAVEALPAGRASVVV